MIPNILWQTWKTKDVPEYVRSHVDSWRASNPQLEVNLWDDRECAQFIVDHFGEKIYQLYMAFPQPIMRADFWRVAVVYVYGGYYADLDVACNVHISKLINQSVSSCFMVEYDNVANFFFGAAPNNPTLKRALDYMTESAMDTSWTDTQSFGMHSLHQAVIDQYNVVGGVYPNTSEVCTLQARTLQQSNTMIHYVASLNADPLYDSWRRRDAVMIQERASSDDITFFTTFNETGYHLYGREWIRTFIRVANYYNKFRARIYYEGFVPDIQHPLIEWVNYNDAIPFHAGWKKQYLSRTKHSDYVKTMTVRFSHKAFVIQHALDHLTSKYGVWLDGDCVFKNADYSNFPSRLLADRFMACQVEHASELNHVESGILLFDMEHNDTVLFNDEFKKQYWLDNVMSMSQPYDGFLIFKTLLNIDCSYVDLNEGYGKGGIQSDPSMTFCHPEIQTKFIHNIGWTGKSQYGGWDDVRDRDDIYRKMQLVIFNTGPDANLNAMREIAVNRMQVLSRLQLK